MHFQIHTIEYYNRIKENPDPFRHSSLSGKTLWAGTKRCDFSWSHMRLSTTPHRTLPTDEGRTKINEKFFLASAWSVFHTKFTTSDLKSQQVCHPKGNWTQITSVEPSTRTTKLDTLLPLNIHFVKTGIENWLSMRIELGTSCMVTRRLND